jgi:hypothetical protein
MSPPLVIEHVRSLPPPPAIYCRMPEFGGVGTGGTETLKFTETRFGYLPYVLLATTPQVAPKELMRQVQTSFGRTWSHLPAIFGVSRQTLYNWLEGEVPKEKHQAKIEQLAAAAKVFFAEGFTPTALALDRPLMQGKSFMALLSTGADGEQTARQLVQVVKRGLHSRAKLDAALAGKTPAKLTAADMGCPANHQCV